MKKIVFILTLQLWCCLSYSQKWADGKWFYENGNGDGFTESVVSFNITAVSCTPLICEGGPVMMSVQLYGTEVLYEYKWYEVGKENVILSDKRHYSIPACPVSYNGKKYRCKVRGMESDTEVLSDEVTLKIISYPEVTMVSPATETSLCEGASLNLQASVVGSGYNYSWTGSGVPLNSNQLSITVRPEDTTVYEINVDNQGCVTTAQTARVNVIKQSVRIKDELFVPMGTEVTLIPTVTGNPVLNWTANGTSYPNRNELKLTVTDKTVVTVEAVSGICRATDECTIFTTHMAMKSGGGNDDGFVESKAVLTLRGVTCDPVICDGTSALMSVQIDGTEPLYTYSWYEVGKENDILSTKNFYKIPVCDYATYNGRKYRCKVYGIWSDKEITSDEVVLNVVQYPSVLISAPANNTTICGGDVVQVKASLIDGAGDYAWTGEGIIGLTNSDQITARPDKSSDYTVSVNNQGCTHTASVRINVRDHFLELQKELFVTFGEMVVLVPKKTVGAVLSWQMDGVAYPAGDTLKFSADANTRVTVESRIGACLDTKECVIHVNEKMIDRYIGGDGDGFIESQPGMDVSGVSYKPVVCVGDKADFKLVITSFGVYTFEWKKEGDDRILSTKQVYSIESCETGHSGVYYCTYINEETKQKVTTDKMTFEVVTVPEAMIVSPLPEVSICYGDRITLKAKDIDPDEKYNWTGENILGNMTLQEITVAPTESTEYQLFVSHKVCWRSAALTVTVERPMVQIPATINVVKGEEVVIAPDKERADAVFNWKVGNTAYNDVDILRFKAENNLTVVRVEKVIDRCTASDSALVYVKDLTLGEQASDGDGYAEQIFDFEITGVKHTPLVCKDNEATFTVNVNGYELYTYVWKKEGENRVYSTEQTFIIPAVELVHAGKYYCEVTDLRTGTTKTSESAELTVMKLPEAEILAPADGTEICEGESIELKATENSGWEYMWTGPDIDGIANQNAKTVTPLASSTYSLTVRNGICAIERTVDIIVKKLHIQMPRVVNACSGQLTVIDPSAPASAVLEWKWEGGSYTGPVFKANFTQSGIVNVRMEYQGCSVADSVFVYVKDNDIFRGSTDDGYDETELEFQILGVEAPAIVCENSDVDLLVRVSGSGLYTYEWRKTGEDRILSREPNLQLKRFLLSQSGSSYYCRVVDLFLKDTLTSETHTITVKKMPQPKIGSPEHGVWICAGESIRLDARETEASKESPADVYNYNWEGNNINKTDKPYIVNVTPTATQVYAVGVEFFGCLVYDTITINVSDPKVIVPPMIYVHEGQGAVITAKVTDTPGAAVVNWWHELRYYPNQPSYELKNIRFSSVVTAEVVAGRCKGRDSTFVFLKLDNSAGGENDGFMESCEVPLLVDKQPQVLGCGGEDSVVLEVKTLGDVNKLIWEKYNEVSAQFEAVQPAANLVGLGTNKLTIHPVGKDDLGDYHCRLENDCGNVYTEIYTVTDGTRPVLAITQSNVDFCEGANGTISVPVLNKEGVSYKWYKKNQTTGALTLFTPERLYNSEFFNFVEIRKAQEGIYIAEAKNACGTTLDTITVNVTAAIKIVKYLQDTAVCTGGNVKLWVNTTGGSTCSYKLVKYVKDAGVAGGYREEKVCTEGGSNEYEVTVAKAEDEGYYQWEASSDCGGTVKSGLFYLSVENQPVFIQVSRDTTVCPGSTVLLTALAESPGSPVSFIRYSWMKDGQPVSGTSANKTLKVTDALSAGGYVCYAANSCPAVASSQIRVALKEALKITLQPTLDKPSFCEATGIQLNFNVDLPALVDSIQWYRNTSTGSYPVKNVPDRITGATANSLVIDTLLLSDAGVYIAKAFGVCGAASTEGVELNVDAKARFKKGIGDQGLKFLVCEGEQQVLKVDAEGLNLQFLWLCNGNPLKETGNSIVIQFDSTATYCCHVQNQCGGEYSCADIKVIRADTFRLAGGGNYCFGEAGKELVLMGSDTSYIYRLYEGRNSGMNYLRELSGKDAAVAGGTLDFGTFKKGTYHVVAINLLSLCEFTMPGLVEIKEIPLPAKYKFEISKELCMGETEAELRLTGSEENRIRYKLSVYNTALATWDSIGERQGTKDTLVWGGIPVGEYRLQAINDVMGCSVFMDNQPVVKERPLPAVCQLVALNNDTIYCQGNKSDITLLLREGCAEPGNSYTLKKNGLLTDRVVVGTGTQWRQVEEGRYTVEASNIWKCKSETVGIRVSTKASPVRYAIRGGGYFCDTDTDDTRAVVLENAETGIRYDFMKAPAVKIHSAYGEGKEIQVNVPLAEETYYIVATDTLADCSIEMANRINLKKGKLELSSLPVSVEIGHRAQLNLTIKQAIGIPVIAWTPVDAVSEPGITNPLTIPILEESQTVYKVTVSDSACTKEHTIQVILRGEKLFARIKQADCTSDAGDTLSLCRGTAYRLCGNVTGGVGEYTYAWSKNGSVLDTQSQLAATADTSGYLVFDVGSDLLRARDSIWLEVLAAPEYKNILVPQTACYGNSLSMGVGNSQPGILYELYQKLQNDNRKLKAAAYGTGSDLVVNTSVESGEYYIVETDTTTKCSVSLKEHYSIYKAPRTLNIISKDTNYCAAPDNGATLGISGAETGVTYYLQKYDGRDFADMEPNVFIVGDGIDGQHYFSGKYSAGQYRIRAHNCGDVIMAGVMDVKEKAYPQLQLPVDLEGNSCIDSLFKIVLNPTEAGTQYGLYLDGVKTGKTINGEGNVDFWSITVSAAGRYTIVADRKGCVAQLGKTVDVDSFPRPGVLEGVNDLCQNSTTSLKIKEYDLKAEYKLYNSDHRFITNGVVNTGVVYFHNVGIGEYYAVGNRGDCKNKTAAHLIHPVEEPDVNLAVEVSGGMPRCVGADYTITILNTVPDVHYFLMSDGVAVDTVYGGGDRAFKPVRQAGSYRILPKAAGICGSSYIDTTIVINRLPRQITALSCQYCEDLNETDNPGCAIEIRQVNEQVSYVLMEGNVALDTVAGTASGSVFFDPFRTGDYRVMAEDQVTYCRDTVAKVSITKGLKPQQLPVAMDGARCGRDLEVYTLGSEGDPVAYYLYRDALQVSGPLTNNDGANISFGVQSLPGIYKIYAWNSLSGCGVFMADSVIVYPELQSDTLIAKGRYCQNEESKIVLEVKNTTKMWNYYITNGTENSDTLVGTGNPLSWANAGGIPFRAGEYILNAVNPCGEETLLDRITVVPDPTPVRFAIVGGDADLCPGMKHEIRLENSVLGVNYQLMLQGSPEITKTLPGTGSPLSFGEYASAGKYMVFGTNGTDGCKDTMDVITVSASPLPKDPGITGDDICLGQSLANSLVIGLTRREEGVSYYLQKNEAVYVDSILAVNTGKKEFIPQRTLGGYRVVAVGKCTTSFDGYKIGGMPAIQHMGNAGKDSVCEGTPVPIWLENSEKLVEYRIYRTTADKYPDSVYMKIKQTGNNGRLDIGVVKTSGIYFVKAYNGCEAIMDGQLDLTVEAPYKILLRKEGYTICDGDPGVKIEILGITNPDTNVTYGLYPPGETLIAETIKTGKEGASITTENQYKAPGYYTIEEQGGRCPVIDSVLIKIRPLPMVFNLSNGGNGYLCVDETEEIVLSGSQSGVDYTLYRKNGTELISKDVKSGNGGRLLFAVHDTGTYIVKGKYTGVLPACEQVMNGDVSLVGNLSMKPVKLEAVRTVYCYNVADDTLRGHVMVKGSEADVEYQLLKDGVPHGAAVIGNPDTTLVWDKLSGGAPKDPRFPDQKYGVDYTLIARSIVTGCSQVMAGKVKVVEEREVQFRDDLLKDLKPCIGAPMLLDVQASGGELVYTWLQKAKGATDWVTVQEGVNSFYSRPAVQERDYGYYKCSIQNTCGAVSTVTVEVNPQLLIVKDGRMADKTICNPESGVITDMRLSTVIKNATTYIWKKDGEILPGANKLWLDIQVSRASGTGIYVCEAANRCGTLQDTCVVSIDSTPAIVLKPQIRDTLCKGESLQIQVESEFEVKWYRGNEYTGRTGNKFEIPAVVLADEGTYFAVVENGCGKIRKETGRIWVDDTIKLISVSEDRTLCESTLLSLYVITNQDASGRVEYRWHDAEGNRIHSGAVYSDIDLTKIEADTLKYRVTYSNACSYKFNDVNIRIDRPVLYDKNTPAKELQACATAGMDSVLRIVHPENMPVDYQWFFHPQGGIPGRIGENADSLVVPLSTASTGAYYCSLTNACTDSTTRTSWVRIDTVPVVKDVLTDATLCENSAYDIEIPFTGGNVDYTWLVQYKTGRQDTIGKGLQISFEGKGILKLNKLTMAYDSCLIWCFLKNACGEVYSDTMMLRINRRGELSVTPEAVAICNTDNTAEVKVRLLNGVLPWNYTYITPSGAEVKVTEIRDTVHILKVQKVGLYKITSLEDKVGCVRTDGLPSIKVTHLTSSFAALSGGGGRCAGDTVSVRVAITGEGAGPWALWFGEKNNRQLPVVNPLVMYGMDTTLVLTAMDSVVYYLTDAKNLSGAAACPMDVAGEVVIRTSVPDIIDFALSGDDHIGQCNPVNLYTKLNPTHRNSPEVVPKGWFYLNTGRKPVTYDNLTVDMLKGLKGRQTVRCEYKNALGCLVSSDEVILTVDTLPFATLDAGSGHACGNVQTEYTVALSGAPKFTLELEQRLFSYSRYRQDEQFRRWTPELGVKDTVYKGVRSWTDTDSCMILRVVAVTDRHGCRVTSPETALPSDTVYHHLYPDLEIQTRYPNVEKSGWTKGMSPVYIARGDSVGVKATLTQGDRPWNMICNPRGTIRGIHGVDTVFALDTGRYRITAVHEYCNVSASYGEELVVSYRDTGYLKMKVLLDGPFDVTSGEMQTAIEDKLPLYGITALPDRSKVRDKQIIDWIEVELRAGSQRDSIARLGRGTVVVAHDTCLLWSDGTVTDRLGDTVIALPGGTVQGINNYYVLVRHRNHLGVMSAGTFPVSRKRSDVKKVVDFTKANSIYTADRKQKLHMSEVGSAGYWALSAGDMNSNALVSVFDPNKMNLDELSPDSPGISAPGGYNIFDVNFDGQIGWPGWGKEGTLDWDKVRGNRHQFMEVRF